MPLRGVSFPRSPECHTPGPRDFATPQESPPHVAEFISILLRRGKYQPEARGDPPTRKSLSAPEATQHSPPRLWPRGPRGAIGAPPRSEGSCPPSSPSLDSRIYDVPGNFRLPATPRCAAAVAELADALASGASGGNPVEVRFLSAAITIEDISSPPGDLQPPKLPAVIDSQSRFPGWRLPHPAQLPSQLTGGCTI